VVEAGPALAVVVVVLVAVATGAVWAAGLPLRRSQAFATGRAALQLAVIAAVLVVVLDSMLLTGAYVALMAVVATLTAAGRIGSPRRRPWTAVPILLGAVPVTAIVLVSGVVPWTPAAVLPIAGILIGNAMTATSVAARRMHEELALRAGEYEAGLAVGLPAPDATLLVSREVSSLALVPNLDQTRTVGLVTLPGAFVGVLLGGGTAVEAGAAQLLVLIGIMAAQSVAVLVTLHLVARRQILTPDLVRRLPT
jgi:putative ABC transport system permease protein